MTENKQNQENNTEVTQEKTALCRLQTNVRFEDLDIDEFDLKYDSDKSIMAASMEIPTKLTIEFPFKIHIIFEEE